MRQHPGYLLHRGSKRRGKGLPFHAHDEAQLIFAASGMAQVHTAQGRWLVPPQLAAWVPAGVTHRVEILSDAELWMVHWMPGALRDWAPPALPDHAFALRVTPLLRALLATAFAAETSADKAGLAVRLMLHEMTEAAGAATFLPMPATPLGLRVAELAFADPANQLDAAALASRAATSLRTLSRLFPAETGMTFKAWRQRARIVHAMDRLARGQAIARVSRHAGFASTAAFSTAFRQVTAMTPTAFLGRPGQAVSHDTAGAS